MIFFLSLDGALHQVTREDIAANLAEKFPETIYFEVEFSSTTGPVLSHKIVVGNGQELDCTCEFFDEDHDEFDLIQAGG